MRRRLAAVLIFLAAVAAACGTPSGTSAPGGSSQASVIPSYPSQSESAPRGDSPVPAVSASQS